MRKYLFGMFLVTMLVLTGVLAHSFNIRGYEGDVNYIGSDLNFVSQKVKLSAWSNGIQGKGSLQVIAKTESGKRIVLIVSFDKKGKGIATYYKQGEGRPMRLMTTVNLDYDHVSKLITIEGMGEIDFKVSNIKTDVIMEKGDHEFEEPKPEEPPEEPEPKEIHDVKIDESYTNTVNGIRIKNKESGDFLLNETSQLICNKKYTVSFRTRNVGNFTENVTMQGNLSDFSWMSVKKNLTVGKTTTTGSKTINITFDPGFYSVNILAEIDFDDNPGDNFKSRDVEVVC